ncbi:MAG TPA: acyl-CoA dehydrogenase family protein [Caulobacteraceae bacterium]|nr:acyl-CoA dehydrogenase family protein [Caulobacteraceae bacterium]
MSNLVPPADVAAIAAQIEAAPGLARLRELLGPDSGASPETLGAVLEEAAKFSAAWLAPLNPVMDHKGCRLEGGKVRTAPGHIEAWRAYVEAGWPGIDQPPELGGAGLPLVALAACTEIFDRGSVAFGMLPTGLRAACRLLAAHADDQIKAEWLPRLVSGEWVGTICISEPDAGSDAGRIRTLAEPDDQGGWRITGEKMWISYGDHDLSQRIGHCLLARTPGAAAGGAGLSLFLVPNLIDGKPNGIAIRRLEEKLGLHGSPTCAMGFEGARGWLIGAEGRGLAQLFTMIAPMRLMVSVQGLTIAAGAADVALGYAEERRQGGPPDASPVLIVEHPDVQRMLANMASRVEVVRGLVLAAAVQADLARLETDPEAQADAAALAGWLLPIAKTYAAETGFEVASEAIQVLGGAGYVKDWPVEQSLRDSRVFAIFEGTSGVQALDLLHRRLRREDGRGLKAFLKLARADAALGGERSGDMAAVIDLLAVLDMLERSAAQLAADRRGDAGAYALLELGALAATGWAALRLSRLEPSGVGGRLVAAGRWWLTELKAKAELKRAEIALGAARLELFQALRRPG